MNKKNVLVIGAGYAGLAAALELQKLGLPATVIEKTKQAGGLSRTIELEGVKFELGPHIYFDKDKEVKEFWVDLVGDKMKSHLRNNRIYYNGKFIKSPLHIFDTLHKLGIFKVLKMIFSSLIAKTKKHNILSAKDWVVANFGKELFYSFFKVYNEKIWGIDCAEISPDWAGQRIKSSLVSMIIKSIKRDKNFIVKTFDFPDGGSETLYAKQVARIKNDDNSSILYNCFPESIKQVENGFEVLFNTEENSIFFSDIISTIHLTDLVDVIDSNEINKVILKENVDKLLYRNLILVNLVFEKEDVKTFQEHWIDIHDPNVKALRVTNFGNYEFNMSNGSKVGIGLEYNAFRTDDIWSQSDEEIIQTALCDLAKMQLANVTPVNFSVVRLPKAYPIYFKGYEGYTEFVFDEFNKINGLHLAGRNSLYKWNNMHHSVKTGILAAKNANGENHNLHNVKGMVSIGKESD